MRERRARPAAGPGVFRRPPGAKRGEKYGNVPRRARRVANRTGTLPRSGRIQCVLSGRREIRVYRRNERLSFVEPSIQAECRFYGHALYFIIFFFLSV